MQRNDALNYLKELLCTDVNASPNSISIEQQGSSEGVIIRIKIKRQDRQNIRELAKKRHLTVEEADDAILIYE
jgi:hypothetical protein